MNLNGQTPLHVACQHHPKLVALLLEAGASVESDNLLHIACQGQLQTVALLLQAGAKVNTVTGRGVTPLHVACEHLPKAVALLLEAEADVNAKDNFDQTPLHIACYYNHQVASLLLTAGANIATPDLDGITPLHLASTMDPYLTKELFEHVLNNYSKEQLQQLRSIICEICGSDYLYLNPWLKAGLIDQLELDGPPLET